MGLELNRGTTMARLYDWLEDSPWVCITLTSGLLGLVAWALMKGSTEAFAGLVGWWY